MRRLKQPGIAAVVSVLGLIVATACGGGGAGVSAPSPGLAAFAGTYVGEYTRSPTGGSIVLAVTSDGALEVTVTDFQLGVFDGRGRVGGDGSFSVNAAGAGSASILLSGRFRVSPDGSAAASGSITGAFVVNSWTAARIGGADSNPLAGDWSGTYSGGEAGTWVATIRPDGTVSARADSPSCGAVTLTGRVTQTGKATFGGAGSGLCSQYRITWTGSFYTRGGQWVGSGTWSSTSGLSGVWSGAKGAIQPPAGSVLTVDPASYVNGTFSATASGSTAYVAGIDMDAFQEASRSYSVSVDGGYPAPAAAQRLAAPSGAGDHPVSPQEAEAIFAILRRGPVPHRPLTRPLAVPFSYSTGSQRSFWMCTQPFANCTASNQVQITATAVHTTQRSAIFVDNDNLDDVPLDLAQTLSGAADRFWQAITANLGLPQNPYNTDGLGQIVFLFTRKVGQIDNLAGFFFPPDLFPDSDTTQYWNIHSNQTNMLYLNSAFASRTWMPSTMAHEFAHLVHFSRRIFVYQKTSFDPTYFVEGLAMAMEDIAGYGYNNNGNARSFVRLFLQQSADVSLVRWGAGPADIRSYYGAAYLVTRYLLDRFGTGTLSRIINSTLDVAPSVESISSEPYGRTFASIAIAIVNSAQRLGITDPRFRYSTIDVSQAGAMSFLNPGSQATTPMNWRFVRGQGGPAQVRVTIRAGTSTPYAGVILK